MKVFFVPIGVGLLLMMASGNGVTEFGPAITWTILLGSMLCVVLLGLEER